VLFPCFYRAATKGAVLLVAPLLIQRRDAESAENAKHIFLFVLSASSASLR
jgi:hypothetical protein